MPPQYREEFSLDEIVSKVSSDINILKAIADIRIEKNNELYDQINTSVIVKRPELLHIRMYKFGMLVGDIVMKNGFLHVLAGKSDNKTGEIINEIFQAVFWWDDIEKGTLSVTRDTYIIRTFSREIHLDRSTLLPVYQGIFTFNKTFYIKYTEPKSYEGYWYPSKIEITVDDLRFTVDINKLQRNPVPGEFDFRVPEPEY